MRYATVAVAAAFLVVTAAISRITIREAHASDCSDYRNELRVARRELERGDRSAAAAALRRAKAALRACGEEDSGEQDAAPHADSDRTVLG